MPMCFWVANAGLLIRASLIIPQRKCQKINYYSTNKAVHEKGRKASKKRSYAFNFILSFPLIIYVFRVGKKPTNWPRYFCDVFSFIVFILVIFITIGFPPCWLSHQFIIVVILQVSLLINYLFNKCFNDRLQEITCPFLGSCGNLNCLDISFYLSCPVLVYIRTDFI